MPLGKRAIGVVCIVLVVLLWVGSSELIQLIFDNSRFRFESPLFLTFYSTALFSIYLFGFIISKNWRRSWSQCFDDLREDVVYDEEGHALLDEVVEGIAEGFEERGSRASDQSEVLMMSSAYTTLILAAKFAPMWIAANLSFNTSLCRSCGTGTSVSSNTLLSSSSGVFTLILSVLFLGDECSWWKVSCVCLSTGGVVLLVMHDGTREEGHNIWGDLMALAAAAFMGAYSVQLKYMLGAPGSPTVSMPMFFGFLGVTAVLLGIPIFVSVVFLQVTGWAHLEMLDKLTPDVMGALTFNGLVGTVLSDVLWAEAVLLTSPLAVNLSTCLTIPLAFLVDHLRGIVTKPPHFLYVVGAVMVFVSFVGVNYLEYLSSQSAEQEQESDLSSSESVRVLRQREARFEARFQQRQRQARVQEHLEVRAVSNGLGGHGNL